MSAADSPVSRLDGTASHVSGNREASREARDQQQYVQSSTPATTHHRQDRSTIIGLTIAHTGAVTWIITILSNNQYYGVFYKASDSSRSLFAL